MKKKTISIIIIILLVLLAATAWYEVPVTEHIKADGEGKVTSPVRFALVTDLHSCYYGPNQAWLIKMIDDARVDAVLLSGDIFDDRFAQDNARLFIEGICDKYPCYYVTGNHEFWGNKQDEVKEYLRSKNVSALDGDYDTLEVRGNTIVIAGVDDPTYMTMDEWTQQFEQADCGDEYRDNYKILISHRPEKGDVYAKYDYDLVVCGHAHGGQWKIPFTQMGVHAPNQGSFPKFVDGLYKLSNGTEMVVSRGLCRERMPYPRFFNHPEVVIIDLE
jgi:predicted MPP superfamily phosphohydrolase